MVRLNPYLSFKNNAREAMEFYKTVFGGKLDISTFASMPGVDPAEANNVMHAQLEGENGVVFMASDTPSHMVYDSGRNISMSLSGDDDALLRAYWDKLSVGGAVSVPLETAPWGDTFGMFTDKFGIAWMVNISGSHA
jgi:PhnB protein